MLLSVLLCLPLTRLVDTASAGSSSDTYLTMAINHAFCGRYAELSGHLGPFSVAELGDRPISARAAERGGSIEAYCAGKFQPYVMNEISVSVLEGYLLMAMPDASLPQLATALAVIRVVMIGLFGFVMLRAGASIAFVFAACLAAHYLTVLLGRDALFSQYPFLVPVVLCFAAGCATLAAWFCRGHWMRGLLFAAALGFLAGFAGNLRTTLYPLVGAAFVLALAEYVRRDGLRLRSSATSIAAVTVFGFSLLGFEMAYISPMRGVVGVANYASHTIAHPLVLGLAAPPNALAKREGIAWDDTVGPALAQRIDPSATYLSPAYEPALWTYYAKLWFYSPREMAQLYVAKWRSTGWRALEDVRSPGDGIFWKSKNGAVLAVATFPVTLLSYLMGLPQVLLAVAVAGMFFGARLNAAAAVLLTSLSSIAFLGYVEAAVILSGTTLWYNGVLLTMIVFLGLLAYQAVIDLALRRQGRGRT